jgi:hypothetical protein
MPCPFFHPIAPMTTAREARPVPLGDFYRGECRANCAAYQPSDAELRDWCNFGYARTHCPRFPASDTAADAVRFAISSDGGSALTLAFTMERDHRPLAHGTFQLPHPDPAVNRLAEAYVEAYRRRKT